MRAWWSGSWLMVNGLVGLGLLAAGTLHAAGLNLKEMAREDFQRAGLEKLSAEELDYLQQWLNRSKPATAEHSPGSAVVPEPPRPPVNNYTPIVTPEREPIESRITGSFSGWSGNTLFRLENGQVWQQSEKASFRMKAESPRVRIVPKALGSWMLRVEGSNRSVRVKLVGHQGAQP